ncbi:potassium/proton antiporter [bacterium]|nr:potassium/proton antiporter [bacterium]
MIFVLVLSAIVIFSAIFTNRFLKALGIPALVFFLCLGLLFGSNEIFKIDYSDFEQAKDLSSIALGFIIFYGGFCTKWQAAKPVFVQATILSTFGVLFTALAVGLFCYYILQIPVLESFLFGAVIGSTDAASVFSILKSKQLHLKENTGQLLELESGSNDPMSYVLVILVIALIQGSSANFVFLLFLKQVILGIFTGVLIAKFAIYIFQKTKIIIDGNDSLFIIALVLTAYAISQIYDGNPFLAVYFLGIILGNSNIDNKTAMMTFFDNITKLAQIGIFFTLGLLATLNKIPYVFLASFYIFLFLTFVARPLVVFILLFPFKSSIGQKLIIAWAGLRGVASIVFAIIAMDSGIELDYDLYHVVFFISLLSIAFQGAFLPWIARVTNMIDKEIDIRKTFNDYQEECAIKFMRVTVPAKHQWINKKISDITFPYNSLVLYIKRDGKRILPKEITRIKEGDRITLTFQTDII